MTRTDLEGRLASIGRKLESLRSVEAEHGFGTLVTEPKNRLRPIDGLPAGATAVYNLFGMLEGGEFRFEAPPEIAGPEAWADRGLDEHCPLGDPLFLGFEIHGAPDGITGAPIRMDLTDGSVYFIDPDDYIFLYKHPGEEIMIEDIAPDVATFFDDFVLGPNYPDLVTEVLGSGVRDATDRKGRPADSWRRLLEAAGLL